MAGFGGIGGVSPIFASIITQPFQAAALRPGQVLQGLVQSIEPQTLIRFGELVIPVEKVEALQPGQAVSAEVVRGDRGLQLRITPGAQGLAQHVAAETTDTPLRDLPGIIVNALQSLGKLDLAEQAVALVPRNIADNPAAVRLVLSLLLDRADGDDDAQRAVRIIQRAIDDGVLTEAKARDALPALRGLTSGNAEEIAPALRHAAAASLRPIAARLAEALGKGGVQQLVTSLSDDLPTALTRLIANEAFAEFLRQTGQSADFHRAVEHLVDRFAAAQLVNARGADVPYLFFALAMPADSAVRHAHIHVMGEGGGKTQRFDAKNATVALDLSTSALGDLWITLSATHGACSCWIRARDLDAVAAIQSHAGELAARLSNAGYPGASVQTALWDGNRVRELATMMRRFKGLNVEA
jgi:hypothetical protein